MAKGDLIWKKHDERPEESEGVGRRSWREGYSWLGEEQVERHGDGACLERVGGQLEGPCERVGECRKEVGG